MSYHRCNLRVIKTVNIDSKETFYIFARFLNHSFKGTVRVISSDPRSKDDNARFTTASLKLIKIVEETIIFLTRKMFIISGFSGYKQELRREMNENEMKINSLNKQKHGYSFQT